LAGLIFVPEVAPKNSFHPPVQADPLVQSLALQKSACAVGQISGLPWRVLLLQEGRCARHETLRRDAVDATKGDATNA
jgi:hypothetical protein